MVVTTPRARAPMDSRPNPERLRRAWPIGTKWTDRARIMTRAYRDALKAERERANGLQEMLTRVDLSSADPGLVEQVKALLASSVPDVVEQLDRQFAEKGEEWHCEDNPIVIELDDEDVVPTKFAAREIDVKPNLLAKLRIRGVIRGLDLGGHDGYAFRVADVKKIPDKLGGRGWRATGPEDYIGDD